MPISSRRSLYFFTLVTYNRRSIICKPINITLLRDSFRQVIQKHPFVIEAIAILPNHLHCIWTLPKGDADFSNRWRLLIDGFRSSTHPTIRDHTTDQAIVLPDSIERVLDANIINFPNPRFRALLLADIEATSKSPVMVGEFDKSSILKSQIVDSSAFKINGTNILSVNNPFTQQASTLRHISETQISSPHISIGKLGSTKIGFGQIGSTQIGIGQITQKQIGSTQIGSTQIGSTQIDSTQIGSTQIGSTQISSDTVVGVVGTEIDSTNISLSEIETTEISPSSRIQTTQLFSIHNSNLLNKSGR